MATRGLPTWPWADTVPDDLPPAEALVLDAARAWTEAARSGAPPLPAARLILVTEAIPHAGHALDALLRAVAYPGTIGNRVCPRITPAEGALLTGLALAQRGTRREALAVFLRIASSARAYAAMGPALGLGLHLRRSGLLLAHPLRATG